ncbi:uncharacterized protein LOC132872884 isoform X2 [Neoarius graeffei]|uniref:uncharacterized protein LOC132872884 isoform X2 n=1 Tax=Neoarius graeffei TaxID=443677 RepID=UPI00298CAEFB|nr:uncharacterized protein LOC132872884 isoform X2 [Neoarius graeffei]
MDPQFLEANHILQYKTTIGPEGCFTTAELDGEQFIHFDREIIPKTKWIKKIYADKPDYRKSEKELLQREHEDLKHHLNRLMELSNHTRGNHTLYRMYRCEIDVNDTCRGSIQFHYDGELFASLDLKTETWIAAKSQAEIFIKEIDPRGDEAKNWKYYLENECIRWLKIYVFSRRETVERKGLNVLYNGTVVLRMNRSIPEFTGGVLVDGVLFFCNSPNILMEKRKIETCKCRHVCVHGHQDDVMFLLSAVLKAFNRTEGSVQWMLVCGDFNITRAYLKFSYNESFIIFHLNNETWTQCDDDGEAAVIIKMLETKFAESGRSILQIVCGGSGRGRIGIFAPIAVLVITAFIVLLIVGIRYMKK